MADNAGGGGYSAPVAVPPAQAQGLTPQPSQQGSQQPQWNPSPNRARMGEFGQWTQQQPANQQTQVMGQDGIPGEQIAVADRDLQGSDPNDPFSPLAGLDAQSQALAVVDQQGDDQQQTQEVSVEGQALSQADLRALLDEYRIWRDSDDLVQPLMSKFVTVLVDGKRWRVPVEEAAKGYQRNADYSAKLREVYETKRSLEQREAGLQRFMSDLSKDGQSFYDTIEAIGLFKQFEAAAVILGTQLAAERNMTPEAREQAKMLREMRMQARAIAQENRRLQAQLQAQQAAQPQQTGQPDQADQIRMQQVAHLLPSVAQRMGLVQTPLAMAEFERHFGNMLPMLNGGDITTEFLENVVGATLESISAQVAAHKAWQEVPQQPTSQPVQLARDSQGRIRNVTPGQQQRQPAAAPPAGRLTGPAQPVAPNGVRSKSARIGDFDRAVRGRL